MKKTVYIILLAFFVSMLCYSAWNLLGIFASYREGEDSYQNLEQYVTLEDSRPAEKSTLSAADETDTAEESAEASQTEATELPDLSEWPQVDFDELARINPDVVGWIYIKDTRINYPVVQGENNDYYLNRLFDGSYNSSGCIFLDADCASGFSERHSIIYGHNMKNKTMFADLMKYKDQEFFETHPEGLLVTPTALYRIRFFSGYVCDNWTDAWKLDLNDETYGEWLRSIGERSYFEALDQPDENDRVLTLSTCTYEFDDAKYVLHGYYSEVIELSDIGQ